MEIETIDDKEVSVLIKSLAHFVRHLEYISGQWNGDDAGQLEDIAQHSVDVMSKIKELVELIDERNKL
jgi:hypothetical protein